MSAILELFAELVLGLLWWLILFPVVWLICAPFILVGAAFRQGPYIWAVSDGFRAVTRIWAEYGIFILP
jgi:predicted ferric reductase